MELGLIAIGIAIIALWWTHTPDETKQAPKAVTNRGISYSVSDLVTHDPKLKAI